MSRRNIQKTLDAFYSRKGNCSLSSYDVGEVVALTGESRPYSIAFNGLAVGFMVGYNAAKREAAKRSGKGA